MKKAKKYTLTGLNDTLDKMGITSVVVGMNRELKIVQIAKRAELVAILQEQFGICPLHDKLFRIKQGSYDGNEGCTLLTMDMKLSCGCKEIIMALLVD